MSGAGPERNAHGERSSRGPHRRRSRRLPATHKAERRDRPGEPLECQFAHRIRKELCLYERHDPLAHENLAALGFAAKARGQVRDRANRGVFRPTFEPDLPAGGEIVSMNPMPAMTGALMREAKLTVSK